MKEKLEEILNGNIWCEDPHYTFKKIEGIRKRAKELHKTFSLFKGEETHYCPLCGIDLDKVAGWIEENYTPNTEVQKEREEIKDDLEFAIRASLIEGDKYCERKVLETNLQKYLSQTKGGKE